MFAKLETLRRLNRRSEVRPRITDPYRQVHTLIFHPVYQGPHSFTGYEHPKPALREWKVVPITTPGHFFKGLDNLIDDVQEKNTKSTTLEPSPFDPLVGTRRYLKDPEAYQRELEKMYKKYSGIHKRILKKFTDEEKKRLDEILTEAKGYQPLDLVQEDPNWRPGINHTTGEPYTYWPYDKVK